MSKVMAGAVMTAHPGALNIAIKPGMLKAINQSMAQPWMIFGRKLSVMVSINSRKAKPDTFENPLQLTQSELESLKLDMQSSLKQMKERSVRTRFETKDDKLIA
ncbi:hypothetical protein [Thalassospira xiamenensis]|uniref:Uncharacterized protein n=1 Tax=Thalassospira xiamenensis TaxID=220697 RepID=A0ABR5XZ06_9PROT|nr:hypothetical protein [Thalassospira xiamenensis]KZD00862.1 hypothetical protein AUP40_21310 [Thalassospira xiamenensis]KZD04142.1 hypothetical protein AUP45_21715 [Thalassospira xiamenensis]